MSVHLSPAPSLAERLRPSRLGDDLFRGTAAPAPPRIYGGEIAAQALAAANETVDDDRLAHSLQCTYLRPGDPALPVDYRVVRVRDGRSFSTRQVEAVQAGKVIQASTVGYHVGESAFEHQREAPAVPGPDGLAAIDAYAGQPVQVAWGDWATGLEEVELRPVPPEPDHPLGRRRFWCRFGFPQRDLAHGAVLTAFASDLTMLASVRLPHETAPRRQWLTTTLTHSVYFHRPHRASDWVLWDHQSPVAAGSRGLAVAHAYDADGVLVASAVQEGLMRSPQP